MIDQKGLDIFAQGVARQVHLDTGFLVGHAAKFDAIEKSVIFTFKAGAESYSFPIVSADELSRANSWQEIFERVVLQVLEETTPWALARKIAMTKSGNGHAPEIPVVIDQNGRRHFRLIAETGFLQSEN